MKADFITCRTLTGALKASLIKPHYSILKNTPTPDHMKIKFVLIACLAITLSACSTVKKTSKQFVDSRINNINWALISFKGKGLHPDDFPNGMPTFIFNMQDGKISGNDGCNNFMGIATYTSNYIKPGAIASTKMACPNATIQNDIYEVFTSENISYRLADDVLRLYVNDAEVMAFREKQ
jgi:heat shock protein HslJ